MCGSLNICELVTKQKLVSSTNIRTLVDICKTLGISTSNITAHIRRKAPYVDKIKTFVGQCSCSRHWIHQATGTNMLTSLYLHRITMLNRINRQSVFLCEKNHSIFSLSEVENGCIYAKDVWADHLVGVYGWGRCFKWVGCVWGEWVGCWG